jgi:hypothetical protein
MTNVVHRKQNSRPSINYDRMRLYQPVVVNQSVQSDHAMVCLRVWHFDTLNFGSPRDLTALGRKISP